MANWFTAHIFKWRIARFPTIKSRPSDEEQLWNMALLHVNTSYRYEMSMHKQKLMKVERSVDIICQQYYYCPLARQNWMTKFQRNALGQQKCLSSMPGHVYEWALIKSRINTCTYLHRLVCPYNKCKWDVCIRVLAHFYYCIHVLFVDSIMLLIRIGTVSLGNTRTRTQLYQYILYRFVFAE